MQIPSTLADLEALVRDEVQEDLHLDYKSGAALSRSEREEISKDVSALANSDGGMIIYGIREKDQLPVAIDGAANDVNREWLENVIMSGINPRIDGLKIVPIPVSSDRTAYVVVVPKSHRGPHQARSKHYFKRYNFKSEPMENYEIEDVRNRRDVVLPLVSVDIDVQGWIMYLAIANIGDIPAEDVRFTFSPQMPAKLEAQESKLLTRGCKSLSPGKVHRFFFGTANESVHDDPSHVFDVEVSYFNRRIGERVSDSFHIDTTDYAMTSVIESETKKVGEDLKKSLEELTKAVHTVHEALVTISTIAGPTGLAISSGTVRALEEIRDRIPSARKVDPYTCRADAFREMLGVSRRMANNLSYHFRYGRLRNDQLETREIHGMTPELAQKLREHFAIDDDA